MDENGFSRTLKLLRVSSGKRKVGRGRRRARLRLFARDCIALLLVL
jgi:hypothetical protein